MKSEEKQIKPIILTDSDSGEQYTLEFNRESVKFAEARGFTWDDVAKFPMTKLPEIFFYAFRMHHPNVARANTDKMLELLGGMTTAILNRLKELYDATFLTLINTDENEKPKNAKLTVDLG